MKDIGKKIVQAREDQGLIQFDIENSSKIKREYLSKIENGHLPNPTIDTLERIAQAIGITTAELIDYPINGDQVKSLQIRQENMKKELKEINETIKSLEKDIRVLIQSLNNFQTRKISILSHMSDMEA